MEKMLVRIDPRSHDGQAPGGSKSEQEKKRRAEKLSGPRPESRREAESARRGGWGPGAAAKAGGATGQAAPGRQLSGVQMAPRDGCSRRRS